VLLLAVAGVYVTRSSRSAGWGTRQVAAVAGAAVLARALGGFVTVASATPRPPGGFAQNTVLLVLSVALVAVALRAPTRPSSR
jgi:heme A synthase